MSHLTDADLVLFQQDEASDRDRIAAHLTACARCRAELDTLRRVLALVEDDRAPVRDAAYGAAVWSAIEARLDPAPAPRRVWPAASWAEWLRFSVPPAALAGAVATLLIVAFHGGSNPSAVPAASDDSVLVAVVEDHLERTTWMLTELNNLPEGADLQDVHKWAEDLASDNRLYRQSAELSGDERIGGLLDDLERVLLEVAHAPGDPHVTAGAMETLRDRLDTRGMASQIRLASAELRARETFRQGSAGRHSGT